MTRFKTLRRRQEERLSRHIESILHQRRRLAEDGRWMVWEDRILLAKQDILYLLSNRIDYRKELIR